MRISKPDRPIPLAKFVEYVDRRKAELGGVVVPRNAGNRRTESKRALLKAIADAGGKW